MAIDGNGSDKNSDQTGFEERALFFQQISTRALVIPTLPSQQPTDTKPLTSFQLFLVAEDSHHCLILLAARNPNCLAI